MKSSERVARLESALRAAQEHNRQLETANAVLRELNAAHRTALVNIYQRLMAVHVQLSDSLKEYSIYESRPKDRQEAVLRFPADPQPDPGGEVVDRSCLGEGSGGDSPEAP